MDQDILDHILIFSNLNITSSLTVVVVVVVIVQVLSCLQSISLILISIPPWFTYRFPFWSTHIFLNHTPIPREARESRRKKGGKLVLFTRNAFPFDPFIPVTPTRLNNARDNTWFPPFHHGLMRRNKKVKVHFRRTKKVGGKSSCEECICV